MIIKTPAGLALALASLFLSQSVNCSWAQPAFPTGDTVTSVAKNGVRIQRGVTGLRASWPMEKGEFGILALDFAPGAPLIHELGIASSLGGPSTPILTGVDPQTILTVGTRNLTDPAGWVAFFDDPPKRPFKAYTATLAKTGVRVESQGNHSTIIVSGLSAGPFSGDWRVTLYPGSRLVQAQTCVSTQRDATAFTYDSGLTSARPSWTGLSYLDNQDKWQSAEVGTPATSKAVRFRAITAQSVGGSVALFPPPHQYFYPLDFVDNYQYVWQGKGYRDMLPDAGFGIRQTLEGDKRHVPWINALPGTTQKLSVFYLLSKGDGQAALSEVRRYTHDDSFVKLDGYKTFSSHYHVEHTLDFLDQQKAQKTTGIPAGLEEPGFVKAFKARGVDIVHLAEFHVGWSDQMRANRLGLLKTMHDECARLSGPGFLLLPGEEPNVHLGGHWLSFFPRPVYWTLTRDAQQPFVEQVPGYGTVYHVGSPDDVLEMMKAENGLMWTAHPRIKGSIGFPDAYFTTQFYKSDRFLGGAWKAMPSDLSKPQLGTRVLDLEDDMANQGLHKYIPGEVDVFKIDTESELYGPMNINYLKIDSIPKFQDGWGSVVNALHQGQFFVSTGEVLIPQFTLGGKESGETLQVRGGKTALEASFDWTFPLNFAEIISGDGDRVYRQRIDLSDTKAFDKKILKLNVDLSKRSWARLEVWDVAGNGAFTQPVWVESGGMVK